MVIKLIQHAGLRRDSGMRLNHLHQNHQNENTQSCFSLSRSSHTLSILTHPSLHFINPDA